MKYLLDTCIISYFFRQIPNVVSNFKKRSPGEIAISTITFMEIEFGLALNPERAKKLMPVWNQLNAIINILPFEVEDGIIAASIRAKLQKKGLNIGIFDVLIAASAIKHDLICVTNNMKEFDRISDLHLENWI